MVFEEIQKRKPLEWDELFADLVYSNVEKYKYFITNLANATNWCETLPDSIYQKYLKLLYKEIEIIKPKIIITRKPGEQYFLNENIHVKM